MLQRRSFLCASGSFLASLLCGSARAAPRQVTLATRLMSTLDGSAGEERSTRGVVAMEVLEHIRQLPRDIQERAMMQHVIARVSTWVGVVPIPASSIAVRFTVEGR